MSDSAPAGVNDGFSIKDVVAVHIGDAEPMIFDDTQIIHAQDTRFLQLHLRRTNVVRLITAKVNAKVYKMPKRVRIVHTLTDLKNSKIQDLVITNTQLTSAKTVRVNRVKSYRENKLKLAEVIEITAPAVADVPSCTMKVLTTSARLGVSVEVTPANLQYIANVARLQYEAGDDEQPQGGDDESQQQISTESQHQGGDGESQHRDDDHGDDDESDLQSDLQIDGSSDDDDEVDNAVQAHQEHDESIVAAETEQPSTNAAEIEQPPAAGCRRSVLDMLRG